MRAVENSEKHKVALITGGSSGIGLAIAHELARRNFSLLLVSNQAQQLEACKREIEQKHKVSCRFWCVDLSLQNSAQQIFDFCKAENIEVEILVNNAGMLIFSEAVSVSAERLNAILQLHVHTPTMLCRLFGEEMKKKKRGYILNVSSISSVMPYPGISLYGPSKTYMRFFSRALHNEMKIHDVHVTCLLPGATATALYDPNRVNISLAKKLGVMHEAEFVAAKAIKAMLNKKAESIPGVMNKFTMLVMPFIPSRLIYLIHKNTNLISKGSEALD